MTLPELIDICVKHKACPEALAALRGCKTLAQACALPKAPAWAYWLRYHVQDLPEDVKRQVEMIPCGVPVWAYWLRLDIKDLPDDVKRAAELKACEADYWARMLRRNIPDLHEDTVRKLQLTT